MVEIITHGYLNKLEMSREVLLLQCATHGLLKSDVHCSASASEIDNSNSNSNSTSTTTLVVISAIVSATPIVNHAQNGVHVHVQDLGQFSSCTQEALNGRVN